MKLLNEEKDKVLQEILLSTQTGVIVCEIARRLGIKPYEAFKLFIKSYTYSMFRNSHSTYSMLGNDALIKLFLNESEGINGIVQ